MLTLREAGILSRLPQARILSLALAGTILGRMRNGHEEVEMESLSWWLEFVRRESSPNGLAWSGQVSREELAETFREVREENRRLSIIQAINRLSGGTGRLAGIIHKESPNGHRT